ncbi:uncharacterized protein LOC124125583 [Haliotis rufescens]|uniref:uncharacterized protein LOC124125583 n=1 Tax=Haliotis rufescens TaxID=6454 RepID=UPI00201F96F4|nr:uncharacterized protein LOC124125583 [Haliotis rufescens]
MRIQCYFVLLATLSCLTASVAGRKNEVLRGRSDSKVVKRSVIDDIHNFLTSAGDSIKTFTQDRYKEIADSLPSMGLDDLKNTLNQLKSIYQKIADKSSAEAERVRKLISEVDGDIAANGSTSWRGSLISAVVLVAVSVYSVHFLE